MASSVSPNEPLLAAGNDEKDTGGTILSSPSVSLEAKSGDQNESPQNVTETLPSSQTYEKAHEAGSIEEDTRKAFVYQSPDTVIPSTVSHVVIDGTHLTCIPPQAFAQCRQLQRVDFVHAENLKEIGERAFADCPLLAELTLPTSIRRIGQGAFQQCWELQRVQWGISVGNDSQVDNSAPNTEDTMETQVSDLIIGKSAFQDCCRLTNIQLSPAFPIEISLEETSFANCFEIHSIEWSSSQIKSLVIGKGAFHQCRTLPFVLFPSSARLEVGESAFQYCSQLRSIYISNDSSTIRKAAFHKCKALVQVQLPDKSVHLDEFAFAECSSLIATTSLSFQSSNNIQPFWQCSALEDLASPQPLIPWLSTRFRNLPPLFEACASCTISMDKLQRSLQVSSRLQEHHLVEQTSGMNPLHWLMANPLATADMVSCVLDAFPWMARRKDSLFHMYPIHFACHNPRLSLPILQCLATAARNSLVKECQVSDKEEGYYPLELAIENHLPWHLLAFLYAIQPMPRSSEEGHLEEALEKLESRYFSSLFVLLNETSKQSKRIRHSALYEHGWVVMVADILRLEADEKLSSVEVRVQEIVSCIQNKCSSAVIQWLANAKDMSGRRAVEVAIPEIQQALKDRFLFLGRYELGNLVYKSSSSLVIHGLDVNSDGHYRQIFHKMLSSGANTLSKREFRESFEHLGIGIDDESFDYSFERWDTNGDGKISQEEFVAFYKSEIDNHRPREVAFLFLKNRGRFERECQLRRRFSSHYVVGIVREMDSTDSVNNENIVYAKSITSQDKLNQSVRVENLQAYKYALIMPYADRNLETIVRSERPDILEVAIYAKEIAQALQHVHQQGFIHGNVKLSNIVRVKNKLRLIDFDASTQINVTNAGARFTSGILPPEMIHHLEGNDKKLYMDYFGSSMEEGLMPQTISGEDQGYVVKAFLDEFKACEKPLPYKLVHASPKIDIWSFGVLLYSMITGRSLWPVDRDGHFESGFAMKQLCEWDASVKRKKLSKIRNPTARALLEKLLQKDPHLRYSSMTAILADPFFNVNDESDEQGWWLEVESSALCDTNREDDLLIAETASQESFSHRTPPGLTADDTIKHLPVTMDDHFILRKDIEDYEQEPEKWPGKENHRQRRRNSLSDLACAVPATNVSHRQERRFFKKWGSKRHMKKK